PVSSDDNKLADRSHERSFPRFSNIHTRAVSPGYFTSLSGCEHAIVRPRAAPPQHVRDGAAPPHLAETLARAVRSGGRRSRPCGPVPHAASAYTRRVASLASLTAEITACHRCTRLVRCRETAAAEPPRRFSGQSYWGRAVPGFGDPAA